MDTPRNTTRVLVVDDEESQRTALAGMIALWGYIVETAFDGQDALEKQASFCAHVIVTDIMMPRMDGNELMRRLRAQGQAPPAIVQTAFGNLETSISVIHDLGAFWFLEKPVQSQALKLLLERAANQGRLTEHAERLERQLSNKGELGEMVGSSPIMQEVFAMIQQVAPSRASVLITGESGTGKELAARAVHQLSPRRSAPFVAINCAAMPDTLMESELFGHEKGAFTGAVERRAGAFELAQNGTVLLDEIGDMPAATQAKLLRVLEDGRVRRLGAKSEIQLDVRILASTNAPLDQATFAPDVIVFRGNARQIMLVSEAARRAGTFSFEVDGLPLRLTAYEIDGGHEDDSVFVPFLDATSGRETYGAGRYLDLEPDEDGSYAIDFNLAYHPSCVYSPRFSCPLTPAENRLPVSIEAGERLAEGAAH